MTPALGWTASLILLITIVYQSRQQLRRDGDGASPWLFLGQGSANALFVIYAGLLGDPVFVVTNALLLAASVYGVVLCARRRGGVGELADAAVDELKSAG